MMDMNDDMMTDRLDYLSDRYEYFFSWLESLLDAPSEMVDMEPGHWEDFVTEPSAEELARMDEEEKNFRASLDWIWHEDENWRME